MVAGHVDSKRNIKSRYNMQEIQGEKYKGTILHLQILQTVHASSRDIRPEINLQDISYENLRKKCEQLKTG